MDILQIFLLQVVSVLIKRWIFDRRFILKLKLNLWKACDTYIDYSVDKIQYAIQYIPYTRYI